MSTPAAQVVATSGSAARARQLVVAVIWLTVGVIVGYVVVRWWAASRGQNAVAAVGVAALVCWFASTLALIVSAVGQNTPAAVPCLLMGTLLRLFIPGAVGVAIDAQRGPLAQAGVMGYIVVFFLLALAVESGLLVRLLHSAPPPARRHL